MKKPFYHHLLSFEAFDAELEQIQASRDEKKHLRSLAEENLHISILDLVMSELSEDDKKTFLKHLHTQSHDALWEFLKTKNGSLEKKINHEAKRLLDELMADIKNLQKGK